MSASIGFEIFARDNGASNTFDRVGRASSRTSAMLRKAGQAAKWMALGIATASVAAAAGAAKLAKGAAEDQRSAAKMALAFRNNAKATREQIAATEDWISAQGIATGVADDDLRPALTRLISATGDVGRAQRLTALAMDVSAGSGKSLESVSTALMKAQNGQVSALSRLGIKTKDAEGDTLSLRDAISSMSEKFKGQAARAAKTASGQYERLKLILSETGESIGYKLLPWATKAASWMINTGIPAIREMSSWLREKLGPSFAAVGAFIQDRVMPALRQFGNDSPGYIDKLRQAAQPVVAWFRANWPQIAGTFKDTVALVTAAARRLKQFWGRWGDDIMAFTRRAWKVVGDQIAGALKVIRGLIRGWTAVLNGDWSGALSGMKMAWSGLWKSAKSILSGAWDGIKAAASRYGDQFVSFWRKMPGRIKGALGDLGGLLLGAGQAIIQGLIDGIGSMVGKLTDKLGSITKLIPLHKGPIEKDRRLLRPAGEAIMGGLVDGIGDGWTPLQRALERVTNAVRTQGDKLRSLLQSSREFARGFQWGESPFAFQSDTGAAPTAASILAFSAQQAEVARQTRANVSRLVKLGLSPALLKKLQAAGSSGQQQIAALAQADRSQIRQLNAYDAATTKTYGAAGQQAANAVYGDQLRQARTDRNEMRELVRELRHLSDSLGKGMTAEVKIKGTDLVAVIRHEQRNRGVKQGERVK